MFLIIILPYIKGLFGSLRAFVVVFVRTRQ